ncbi:M24 family metallopeptidase [Paraburkholderia sp. J41]|uniref:M24 family metallopeptidase n=1 Tax=Paraburkholderia sp. J41 TaxID=2805433 RepID=UPI002AC31253|nr:M24 family metallopeptidase [Paraburkholderia sp. J41]
MSLLLNPQGLEAVGSNFDIASMLEVRNMTRDAVNAMGAAMHPGMREDEATEIGKDVLADKGLLRGWHDVVIRFGRNTVKNYGEPSEPDTVLGENDIYMIDIGPVWKNWEGDCGDTFVTGSQKNDYARCAEDARGVFHAVRKHWLNTGATGQDLYAFATAETRRRGWELNLNLAGHRLSDFPHAAAYEGLLSSIDFKPQPLLWVLEIHIRHPDMLYGAFYEDMLLDDSYFS